MLALAPGHAEAHTRLGWVLAHQGLLAEAETRARNAGAGALYLAVLDANPRGAAFWAREGFTRTGVSREDEHGHTIRRLLKPL